MYISVQSCVVTALFFHCCVRVVVFSLLVSIPCHVVTAPLNNIPLVRIAVYICMGSRRSIEHDRDNNGDM